MSYFKEIDSELKAYLLSTIIFNVKKFDINELIIQVENTNRFSKDIETELKKITSTIKNDSFVINSNDIIQDILNHCDLNEQNKDIEKYILSLKREYAIEFLKAFYEKYSNINENICTITSYSKKNLEIFAKFFNIPYTFNKLFNLEQLIYTNVNIIDLLGIIYKNNYRIKDNLYDQFQKLLNNERPQLKYMKISTDAISPTKANFSDVGYDLSIIGVAKEYNSKTKLYNTGIKLDIPIGYYVEIVPRSSISKSGYMLANSIGIIDCSYKGELFVPLIKIVEYEADIEFPFRCCQLIMRKQIYPDMIETNELQISKRSDGGFGSSG